MTNHPEFAPYTWDTTDSLAPTSSVHHEFYMRAFARRDEGKFLGWGAATKRTTAKIADVIPDGAELLGEVIDTEYSVAVYTWPVQHEGGSVSIDVLLSHREANRMLSVTVGCEHSQLARDQAKAILEQAPIYQVEEADVIPVQFWTLAPNGPRANTRNLDIHLWADTQSNYPGISPQLDELTKWTAPPEDGGKLILFHGPPGTGKTSFIRSMAAEWKSWCEVSYIVDPDAFFNEAYYMVDVLLHEADNDENWRLIVIEDADKLIAPEAKQTTGQALPRLLNVCDGLVGQGLKILVLITTNENFKDLHGAVIRPGRCVAQVDFETFNQEEASLWLKEQGKEIDSAALSSKSSLADLYSYLRGAVPEVKAGTGFTRR